MMLGGKMILAAAICLSVVVGQAVGAKEKMVGVLESYKHGVFGSVYFIDGDMGNKIKIKSFHYDGKGREAFFYVGFKNPKIGYMGKRINYPNANVEEELRSYKNADVTFMLPEGYKNKDLLWVSVWCRKFKMDFGSLSLGEYLYKGELNTMKHRVTGDIYFIGGLDGTEVSIKNFNYDGLGPDAFIYVGFTHDKIGYKGVRIDYPDPHMDTPLGKYYHHNLNFTLPSGYTNKNLLWISIWCRKMKVDFGSLSFHSDVYAGELSTKKNDVAGDVYFVNGKNGNEIKIKNFKYNGKGPDAFIYVGFEDYKVGKNGKRIDYPDPKVEQILGKYDMDEIVFTLPKDKYNGDLKWISIWCRKMKVDFGSLMFKNYKYKGYLSTKKHGVMGDVYFVGGNAGMEVLIKDFSYTGKGPAGFIYVGFKDDKVGYNGVRIDYPNPKKIKKLGKYEKEMVKFSLPKGYYNADLKWISIWCREFKVDFGSLSFGSLQYVGELETKKHGVTGDVFFYGRENGMYIKIKHFNYDGKGKQAFIYVGFEDYNVGMNGMRIDYPNPKKEMKLGKYKDDEVVFKLPDGYYNKQLKWISIWCREMKVDFGSIMFKNMMKPDMKPGYKPDKKPTKKPGYKPDKKPGNKPGYKPDKKPGKNPGKKPKKNKNNKKKKNKNKKKKNKKNKKKNKKNMIEKEEPKKSSSGGSGWG